MEPSHADLCFCGFVTFPSGTITPATTEERHMLVWTDRGSCVLVLDGGRFPLTPRTLAFCPAGSTMQFRWEAGWARVGYVLFQTRDGHTLPRYIEHLDDDAVRPLLRHMLWLQMEQPDDWARSFETVFTYVLEMLETGAWGMRLNNRPPMPELIEKAMSYVARRWADAPMRPPTLGEIGAAVNVSSEHLCHVFGRELGHPPMTVLRLLRLHWGATMLRQSSASVRVIGGQCGFQNEFHFSVAFKRWVGVPPSTYRSEDGPPATLPNSLQPLARFLQRQSVETQFPDSRNGIVRHPELRSRTCDNSSK